MKWRGVTPHVAARETVDSERCHPDFTQELPRKLLPTRAKEAQKRQREKR